MTLGTPNQPILLVEDSPEDFEATVRAFNRAGLKNPIVRCEDGDWKLDQIESFVQPMLSGRFSGQRELACPGFRQ